MDKIAFFFQPEEESEEHFSPYKHALIQRVIDPEISRDEARSILRGYFPQYNEEIEEFLKTLRLPPAQPYVPNFELRPWNLPFEVQEWFKDALLHITGTRGGRPSSLVLIGPPGCGKTTFALTFGCPALIKDRWDVDEVQRPGMTHLVMKNVDLRSVSCKRALAGCQMELFIEDQDEEGKQIKFGRPVIWVCTPETSPLNDPEVGSYLKNPGCNAVIMEIKSKMYW